MRFGNRIRVATTTTGTGNLTLGSAAASHQSFADAGIEDGDYVRYIIEDGTAWEIGIGTYTTAGPALTRASADMEASSTGSLLNLSGNASIYVSPSARDLIHATPRRRITQDLTASAASIQSASGSTASSMQRDVGLLGPGLTGTPGTATSALIGVSFNWQSPASGLVLKNAGLHAPRSVLSAHSEISTLSDATDEFAVYFGGHDFWAFGSSFANNGLTFVYDRATYGDHNWRAVRRAASGTAVVADLGVAPVVGTPQLLEIFYDSATSVRFKIDGVTRGAFNTTIPAVGTGQIIRWSIRKTAGTAHRNCYLWTPTLTRNAV
jgi:hypothetical protein